LVEGIFTASSRTFEEQDHTKLGLTMSDRLQPAEIRVPSQPIADKHFLPIWFAQPQSSIEI